MSFRNKILARLDTLDIVSSPPPVLADILSLIGRDDATGTKLLKSILKNTNISARVLKTANSAFRGGEVNNIDQAIMVLGENLVKCLVFSISIYDHIVSSDSGRDREYGRLWRHLLETASAAKNLALIVKFESSEKAYVAGLIHDIGRLFLLRYFARESYQVVGMVARGRTLLEAERQHLGIDHQEIGLVIARRWNLPEFLQEAVRNHHPLRHADPDEMCVLSRIIALSDNLSLANGEYPQNARGAISRIETIEACSRLLNVNLEDIKRVYATFADDVLSSSRALDLRLGDALEYLSQVNGEIFELYFGLAGFIPESREPAPRPSRGEKIDRALESLRLVLTTLSYHIDMAIPGISNQCDILQLMYQKGDRDGIFEKIPAVSRAIKESTQNISMACRELSSIANPENIRYFRDSKPADVETSLKEKLEPDMIGP